MRRSRLFLLAGVVGLLLALAAIWQWRSHERDGSAALTRGVDALNKGDMRAARVELMNAIKRMPQSAVAHAVQARVLADLGDGTGAQAQVERARALRQPPAFTRVAMAEAWLLQGDAQAALAEARSGDIPSVDRAAADRVMARALAARGEAGDAFAILQQSLAAAPRDARSWIELGRLQLHAGDQAAAIGAADRAVALAPSDVKALTFRGELTRSQYGLVAALPWFERALAIDKASVPALEHYAATLADAGRATQAVAVARRLLAVDPGNARAWMIQAVIAARGDDPDLARTLLERTGGRLDAEPATGLLRGILQMQGGNPLLAVDTLARVVEEQPDNGVALTLLGRAYYLAGDFASAATTLAPLVARRDADPYVLTLGARAQEALGDGAMAADMLTRAGWPVRADAAVLGVSGDAGAAAASPPADAASARANIPYLRALLDRGRAAEAVDRALLLTRANPGAPDAWMALGDSLTVLGRQAEAARAYEAAANLRFDRNAALRLVSAWSGAGDLPRAAAVARLFASQNPASLDAARLNAALAMQRQDWRAAQKSLDALRERIGGHDAALMAGLAQIAMDQGDGARARVYALHAYRLMPANAAFADLLAQILLRSGGSRVQATDLLEKAVAMQPGASLYRKHLEQARAARR